MSLKLDLHHIEKRAKEVLKAAPEQARLGRPDVREWWCEMLVLCVAEVRELREALTAANRIIREQDVKLQADAKALVALKHDVEHLQRELNRCHNR